jgi:hypothetical protein
MVEPYVCMAFAQTQRYCMKSIVQLAARRCAPEGNTVITTAVRAPNVLRGALEMQNGMLRRGGWSKLHVWELHNGFSSSRIIRMIKSVLMTYIQACNTQAEDE